MASAPVDLELVRFAFTVGIAVAILFYDRFHLSTGSVMVPAYIGLGLMTPWVLVGATLNAAATFWVVHRFMPRFVVMSRLGKFHAVLVLSVFMQVAWQHLLPALVPDFPVWLAGIGYVIPGLIAHDMNRQGVRKTTLSIGGCSLVVWLALLAVSALLQDSAPRSTLAARIPLAIHEQYVPLALFLSTAAAATLQRHYGLRCGGYVSSAYLGLLALDPAALLYVGAAAILTRFIVTRIVAPGTILFGRRKFAAMQMIGGIVSWGGLWFGERFAPSLAVAAWCSSMPVFVGIVLTGLLANDLENVGWRKVAQGTTLTALFSMLGTLLVIECLENQRVEVLRALATGLLLVAAIVFGPTLQQGWSSLTRERSAAAPRLATSPAAHSPRLPAFGLAAFVVLACFAPAELFPWSEASLLAREREIARALGGPASLGATHWNASVGAPSGALASRRALEFENGR